MKPILEVFVFSNGSACLEHCMKAIREQRLSCKVTKVNKTPLTKAMKYCTKNATCKFFAKLDDDMFLHPAALAFYDYYLRRNHTLAMFGCRLFDFRTRISIQSFKAYNTKVSGKIGFRADEKSRIDRVFLHELKVRRLGYYIDDWSVVGIHAHRSIADQELIRSVWSKDGNNRGRRVGGNPVDYESQYNLVGKLLKLGIKSSGGRRGRFVRFVKEHC